MELPTKKDLEDMVETIYQESKKVFKYNSNFPPTSNFPRFLQALNRMNLIPIPHACLEKDMLILRISRQFPYTSLTTYIYALAFIKYDNTINSVGIEQN